MFKFEDNPFKNNKVTANNSQKMKISIIWPSKSRSFMSEGQGLSGYF
jgi:hypothetical protein